MGILAFLQAIVYSVVIGILIYLSKNWVREKELQGKLKKNKKKNKKNKSKGKGNPIDTTLNEEKSSSTHHLSSCNDENATCTSTVASAAELTTPRSTTMKNKNRNDVALTYDMATTTNTSAMDNHSYESKQNGATSVKSSNSSKSDFNGSSSDEQGDHIPGESKESAFSTVHQSANVGKPSKKQQIGKQGHDGKSKTRKEESVLQFAHQHQNVADVKDKNTQPTSNTMDNIIQQAIRKQVSQDTGKNWTTDDSDDSDLCPEESLKKRGYQVTVLGGKLRKAKANTPLQFSEGQAVLAKYQGKDQWFKAVITKVSRDKTFTITYDDGAVETKVSETLIRAMNSDYVDSQSFLASSDGNEELSEVDQEGIDSSQTLKDDCPWVFDAADDGWEVVTARQRNKLGRKFDEDTGEEVLTKKQRESRRKREKNREKKEVLRSQAQDEGLHARWGGTLRKWTSST